MNLVQQSNQCLHCQQEFNASLHLRVRSPLITGTEMAGARLEVSLKKIDSSSLPSYQLCRQYGHERVNFPRMIITKSTSNRIQFQTVKTRFDGANLTTSYCLQCQEEFDAQFISELDIHHVYYQVIPRTAMTGARLKVALKKIDSGLLSNYQFCPGFCNGH